MPTLGQSVLYVLTELDAEVITDRRRRAEQAAAETGGPYGPCGADVSEGDLYPAVVVRAHSLDGPLSLQVFLDGTDTHWAQHVDHGTTPGTWCWPDM